MTLREYRKGDGVGVADLWRRNPSDEFPLLGFNPDAVGGVLRQTERPMIRFILGIARLFGRPLFVMFIVDQERRVIGTTMITFTRESGFVSGVTVDTAARRQGHARAMLQACDAICRRYHRPAVVLDVLAQNDPALRLYDGLGYQLLRNKSWLYRSFGPDSPLPAPTGTTRIRPFRRSDGAPLAEIDNAQMPPEVRAVIPRHAGEFREPAFARSILASETECWVAEVAGRPVGFLRSTVSGLMEAANLTSPLFRPDVADSVARDLLATALRWIEQRKSPRVITELPDHRASFRPLLESLGFAERFQERTLVHRLAV